MLAKVPVRMVYYSHKPGAPVRKLTTTGGNPMQDIRIGQNIAVLRKNSRLTQEQLAQALHISAQAVSKWENGVSQT